MLAAGVLGLAVLGALLTGSPGGGPGPGVLALPVPDHVHVVHRGVPASVLPRPLASLIAPVPRRRQHVLDPRTAINLVNAHESRRRRGSKRPPPYHLHGPPPRPGPRRPPRYKGAPKRKGQGGPRKKPWSQATRASSPAATRVRYQTSSKKSKGKKASLKGKSRPPPRQLPSYADGYADDEDLHGPPRDPVDDADPEEDRPRKRPSSSKAKQSLKAQGSYPKGWGPDGGYRVPAPQYPPYGTDEEEPGTGHLDLEERFINQHSQFYQHGYPSDNSEGAPTSTKSKRKPSSSSNPFRGQSQRQPGLYDDEEIEVAEALDDFAEGGIAAATSQSTRHQSYRRPSQSTRYSLQDGALHEVDEGSQEQEYRRPYGSGSSGSSTKSRGKKKHQDSRRHQSMYHAKFREQQQDDRTLSAANFNYELTGAASETAHASVNKNNGKKNGKNNHRPSYDAGEGGVSDVRTADANFFRTRKPQYWG